MGAALYPACQRGAAGADILFDEAESEFEIRTCMHSRKRHT
jgi:hypothetical protein